MIEVESWAEAIEAARILLGAEGKPASWETIGTALGVSHVTIGRWLLKRHEPIKGGHVRNGVEARLRSLGIEVAEAGS